MERILKILKEHENWRKNCINLIASENIMSPLAEKYYINDLMHRYAEGKPYKRFYQGTKYVDEIEVKTQEIICEIFECEFCDIRPISGTIANFSTFYAIKNKRIALNIGLSSGAHISHELGIKTIGYKVFSIPFDIKEWNVDLDKAKKIILEKKPDVIILGASLYLFRHPIKEIKEIAEEVNSIVVHDSAHVLGLHLGDVFRNPLKDGCDVVTASTHKTFPGPQGGLILSNSEEIFKKIYNTTFPYFVSNYHLHRYIALAITSYEMKEFGEDYAKQIVKNAKTLAEELYAYGLNVVAEEKGFTETHQVAVDVREFGGGDIVAKRLEMANIILNKNMLPWDDNPKNPSGIRIGVQEMTRFGMKESEMKYIAELIKAVIIDNADVSEIREEVIEFRKEYQEVKYCFKKL